MGVESAAPIYESFPIMTRLWTLFSIILGLGSACVSDAAAQDRTPRLGVMFTLANASLDWSPDLETYRVRRMGGGVTFELPLTDSLSVEARGLITQRGGNTISPSHRGVTARIVTQAITVPVMLKIGKATGPYIAGGVEISYRIKSKYRLDGVSREVADDLDDLIPRTDYGFVFGAGFAMKNAFVEAMYSMSRKDADIFDSDIPQFRVNNAFRPRALTLGAGVRF